MSKQIESIKIEDDLDQSSGVIEVIVTLVDGETRWCFFMTPEIAKNCGDFLPGTEIRIHRGVPHMFLVSELSAEIIYDVLNMIDSEGEILSSTSAIN